MIIIIVQIITIASIQSLSAMETKINLEANTQNAVVIYAKKINNRNREIHHMVHTQLKDVTVGQRLGIDLTSSIANALQEQEAYKKSYKRLKKRRKTLSNEFRGAQQSNSKNKTSTVNNHSEQQSESATPLLETAVSLGKRNYENSVMDISTALLSLSTI